MGGLINTMKPCCADGSYSQYFGSPGETQYLINHNLGAVSPSVVVTFVPVPGEGPPPERINSFGYTIEYTTINSIKLIYDSPPYHAEAELHVRVIK